jgi:hypothetical protein
VDGVQTIHPYFPTYASCFSTSAIGSIGFSLNGLQKPPPPNKRIKLTV